MWYDIETMGNRPIKGSLFLGYDVYYDIYHICVWRGALDDKGKDRLLPVNGSDDCYIRFWSLLPDPPKIIGFSKDESEPWIRGMIREEILKDKRGF